MAVSFQASEPLGNLMAELSAITNKGQYNEQMKLPKPPAPKPLTPFSGLPAYTAPQGARPGVTAGTAPVGGDLGRLMAAIRGQESGGNYGATNPSGASGAYQILRSNFENAGSGWDMEALGRDVSYNEFMSNQGIQDQIAKYKLGQYMKSRGMAGAAATWYGGDWGYNHMYDRKPQAGYPSMYDYVMSVIGRAQ